MTYADDSDENQLSRKKAQKRYWTTEEVSLFLQKVQVFGARWPSCLFKLFEAKNASRFYTNTSCNWPVKHARAFITIPIKSLIEAKSSVTVFEGQWPLEVDCNTLKVSSSSRVSLSRPVGLKVSQSCSLPQKRRAKEPRSGTLRRSP